MSEKPSVKDLMEGRICCPGCQAQIHIHDFEPLQMISCPECGAPVFNPFKVKDYWLYKPLGGGGMGSVYRAVSEEKAGEFAVKILPREKRSDPELIAAIAREGEIGTIIGEAPNIVEVVDYGCYEEEYFIASRFVEGTRLDIFISSASRLSERQALDIILQITDAEMHIVNCGFLYRDIKPENVIIVEETAQVKLFDFGLCMSLEQASDPDASDALEGSPFYLPPERIVAAPEGEYSEIYSIGMLLFHMLSGTTYFSQAEVRDLVNKHVSSLRVASVTNRLKHCTPELSAMLDKMIARDPNCRYHRLADLKVDLERICSDASGYALSEGNRRDAMSQPSSPPDSDDVSGVFRRKTLKVLLVILAVTAVGVGSWHLMNYHADNARMREIRINVAEKLGISPDVRPPSCSFEEAKRKSESLAQELFSVREQGFPVFDAGMEVSKICGELSIPAAMPSPPEHSVQKLTELYSDRLEEVVSGELGISAGEFPEAEARRKAAESLGLALPVAKPERSAGQILEEAEKEADRKAMEKFPSKDLAAANMKVLNTYRSCREGEDVTITDQTGQKVSGTYRGREGNRIIIGTRKILITDLPMDERMKFDQALSSAKCADEIKRLKDRFDTAKTQFRTRELKTLSEEMLKDAGYRMKEGKYVHVSELVDAAVEDQRGVFEGKLRGMRGKIVTRLADELHKDKFFRGHGYVLQNGHWVSQKDAVEKLLSERRDAYEKDRAARVAEARRETLRQAEEKVFSESGYIFVDGSWRSASEALDARTRLVFYQTKE
ncbi:MAG: protein kinase [Victivallales bacterium]|nr:protein kinase [Victivallales bacterium]